MFHLPAAICLFLCSVASAQQYHDAAAFGLQGNVKECKVVNADNGAQGYDSHYFQYLSFESNGKVSGWESPFKLETFRNLSDFVRQDGLLRGFKYKEGDYLEKDFSFCYKDGKLTGLYIRYKGDEMGWGWKYSTTCYTWRDKGANSFEREFLSIEDNVVEKYFSIVAEEYKKGGDILPRIVSRVEEHRDDYERFVMGSLKPSHSEVEIISRDSHGNYTRFSEGSHTYERIITYWDEDPVQKVPSSAGTHPVTAHKNKEEVTANASSVTHGKGVRDGLRAATPKDLSVIDLITRPFGVLSVNSRKLPYETVSSQLEGYGWVQDKRRGIVSTSISTDVKDGYDMRYLGVVPQYAYAGFSKNQEEDILYYFSYYFYFNKAKKTQKFIDTFFSQLRENGIDVRIDDSFSRSNRIKYIAEYNNTVIEIEFTREKPISVDIDVSYMFDGHWL